MLALVTVKLLSLMPRNSRPLHDWENLLTTSVVSFVLNHHPVGGIRAVEYQCCHGYFTPGQPTTQHICGYISGISADPSNLSVLYIADAYHGILKLDLKSGGKMVTIVDSSLPIADVPPMRYISDLTVLSNGSIFFTDASSKFGLNESLYEVFEGEGNGKLLHYNPADKSVRMVASGLHFPNGLCASHDESFLLVADTTRARILR